MSTIRTDHRGAEKLALFVGFNRAPILLRQRLCDPRELLPLYSPETQELEIACGRYLNSRTLAKDSDFDRGLLLVLGPDVGVPIGSGNWSAATRRGSSKLRVRTDVLNVSS